MYIHNWMVTHWKPATAFVYSLVVIFDFIVFPSWVGIKRTNMLELVALADNLDPMLMQEVIRNAYRPYTPYTLMGAGLFHLAMGAILTGSAIAGSTAPGLTYGPRGAEFRRRSGDDAVEPSTPALPPKSNE